MNYLNIDQNLSTKKQKQYTIFIKKVKNWISQKVASAKASGITLGLSGGIDSSVLAILCDEVFPKNAYFYYFEIKEDKKTKKDLEELAKHLKNEIKIINLKNEYESLAKTLSIKDKLSKANLKSRLYMSSLYALSQEKNTLVIGTDNYDEYFLGYFTKYGDGGCDLLPFANINKTQVYVLANMLDIPECIIKKEPSANLYPNQTDEKELGFNYETFELWKRDCNLVSKEINDKIIKLHKISEHKRNLIPKGPKL